jgi:hypothetical protein
VSGTVRTSQEEVEKSERLRWVFIELISPRRKRGEKCGERGGGRDIFDIGDRNVAFATNGHGAEDEGKNHP